MKLRTFIIVFAAFLLIFNYLTMGKLWDFLIPNASSLIGTVLCAWGGSIYQPTISLGGLLIPLPAADDLAYTIVPTIALSALILRMKKEWRSLKSIILVFLIVLLGMICLEKALALYMVYLAESSYGMENCLQGIQIAGQEIPYSLFSPLYAISLALLIPGIIISVVKLKKESAKKSDA